MPASRAPKHKTQARELSAGREAASQEPGPLRIVQSHEPPRAGASYPAGSTVHTYKLVGILPEPLVDALHHLHGGWSGEEERSVALLTFRGWLEGVVRWRASVGCDATGNEDDAGLNVRSDSPSGDSCGIGDSWLEAVGPLWMHYLPSLLLHPTLRSPTLSVHALYVSIWPDLVANSLPRVKGQSMRRIVIGTLFAETCPSHPLSPLPSFQELGLIVDYLREAIYRPDKVWENIDPRERCTSKEQSSLFRAEIESRDPIDVKMMEKIQTGAFDALSELVRRLPSRSATELLADLLGMPKLWTSLSTRRGQALGSDKPWVRRCAWMLLGELITFQPQLVNLIRPTVSLAVFESCWTERDLQVVGPMFQSTRQLLIQFPESWMDKHIKTEDCSDGCLAVDGGCPSAPFARFLSFLRNGCNGCLVEGYQLAVEVISTIPQHVFSLDTPSLDILFDALWTAEPALTSLPKPSGVQALLRAIRECASITFGLRMSDGNGRAYPDATAYAAGQTARTRQTGAFEGAHATLDERIGELDQAVGGPAHRDEAHEDEEYFLYEDEEDGSEEEGMDDAEEDVEVEDDRLSVGSGADEAQEDWEGEDRWTVGGEDASADRTDNLPHADPFAPPAALRILSPSVLSADSILACLATNPTISYLFLPISLPNLFILAAIPSTITHLALHPSSSSPAPTDDIEAALLSLPHLLYLDLRHLPTLFTLELTLSPFVAALEHNPRIQMVWLPPRPRWRNTPWDGLRDTLNEHLTKNRARQRLMRSAAVRVLKVARAGMLGLQGRGGLRVEEVRREVVRWAVGGETGELGEKEVGRVISWAGERRTLSLSGSKQGREDFLKEVGCWRVEMDDT